MAPPSNRRPGYSRRAQYSTFIGYVAGVVGAVVGAGLLGVSLFNPDAFQGLRGVAADVTAPLSNAASAGRTNSLGIYDTISGYFIAGNQNARLRKENEVARVRLAEADAIAEENLRLKDLLHLTQANPKPIATARLIGSTPYSTRRFATLGAGTLQGVQRGMPIRSPRGLIGRVLETGQTTSRVLLVTDPESVVPVRRAQDGIPGFAQGRADGTLQIRLISLGVNPLKKGDVFVTSGSGGLYWPNVAVAMVTQLTRDGAIARVLSDPAATDFVAVDQVWSSVALEADTLRDNNDQGEPPAP